MSGLPPGTVGDAVGVLIYTFICLMTDLLLIWLLWVHRERFGYVALIAYFVALCVVSSIIQQIYQYTNYSDVMWTRYYYIKANYPNAEVIFKNGNSGLSLALSNLRFYCYIIECTYLFAYTLYITLSIYGVWALHRRVERAYVILSKILPPVLTAITIGLEYTPAVQSSWVAYMFVANVQAVASCIFSIGLIAAILWKYVDTKRLWKNIRTGPMLDGASVSWKSWILRRRRGKNPSSSSDQSSGKWDHVPRSLLDNNWLVMRLSIAIVFITGFILATLLVHLPTPAQMAREIMADGPDLSVASAKASIIGYIYGVLPGLAIPIVFGLTKPFRQTLYKTFVAKRCRTTQKNREENQIQPAWFDSDSNSNSRMIPPPAPAPGTPEYSESRMWNTPGGHPATPGQNWNARTNMNFPTDLNAENSYELGGGTSQHQKPVLAATRDPRTRPKSLDSTTSFDSLIQWPQDG